MYGARHATRGAVAGFYTVMDEMGKALAADLDGSFPVLVDQIGRRLYWGLRRLCGDHQEAEDLTQETFIRAYRALSGYDTERIASMTVEPWLWTIALNLGRNHLRDRSRRPTFVKLEESGRDDPEPLDGVAWDRRLSRLNGHQRNAVVLRHVIGLGVGEIAEATGRPEGTVKADVHRGLAKLKELIEEES
jgi:RNA polymerase sigma factor (sigma-70 family)